MNPQLVSKQWYEELTDEIRDLRLWLLNPANVDDTVESIADMLVEKHHDYGEDNLTAFGEYGILVRSSDKIARLKNLIEKPAMVQERREDTWRDLAGYAVQALILMKRNTSTPKVDLFEIRKNRLIRGFCPDCGKGVLLRRQTWDVDPIVMQCSEKCGFSVTLDLPMLDAASTTELIHCLAGREAIREQLL